MHEVCFYSNCEAICNCVLKMFAVFIIVLKDMMLKNRSVFGKALSKCGFSRVLAEQNLKLFLV